MTISRMIRKGAGIAQACLISMSLWGTLAHAASFYQSPQISTPSPLAEMWLAGNFSFQSSTIPANKISPPPLVIGSTTGIIGANFLGIKIGTATFNSWVRAASVTVSGEVSAGSFKGDGSQLYNIAIGSFPAVIIATNALSARINALANFRSTTDVSLSNLLTWSSTSNGRIDNIQTWLSTQNAQVKNYISINSTNTNLLSSFNNWTRSNTFTSSTTQSGGNLTIVRTDSNPKLVLNGNGATSTPRPEIEWQFGGTSLWSIYSNLFASPNLPLFIVNNQLGGGAMSFLPYDEGLHFGFQTAVASSTVAIGGSGFNPPPANNANMSIGREYVTYAAPRDGLIVEGAVGIGTVLPTSKLHVVGTMTASGISVTVGSFTNIISSSGLFLTRPTVMSTNIATAVDVYLATSPLLLRSTFYLFATTNNILTDGLNLSTTSISTRLNSGAITVYDNGILRGNITTISLGANLYASISGSTATMIAITSNTGGAFSGVWTSTSGNYFVLSSTIDFPDTEFERTVSGSSVSISITRTTHTFTANQIFESSISARNLSVLGTLLGSGNATFQGTVTSSQGIISLNQSTAPTIDLTDGNQVWRFTMRNISSPSDKMFVLRDAAAGYERFQINAASGNVMIGGDIVGGLNAFKPTQAKFTVVGGSVDVVGANAQLNVRGFIKTTSGYFFPDGTLQNTSASSLGQVFSTDTSRLSSTMAYTAAQTFLAGASFYAPVYFASPTLGQFLFAGTSIYTGTDMGVFLTTAQIVDNGKNGSPVLKFFASGDSDPGLGITQFLSSYTVSLKQNTSNPPTMTSNRLAFVNALGSEGLTLSQDKRLGINQSDPDYFAQTSSAQFAIGSSVTVAYDGYTTIVTTLQVPAIIVSTISANGITYEMPQSGGSNGQILATDSNGQLSWSDVPQAPITIIVGTSTTRGATVISTCTAGLGFATSSCTFRPCNIYLQAGNYASTGTVKISSNVVLQFEKGAVITYDGSLQWHTLFQTSGTIFDAEVNIATAIMVTTSITSYTIFDMYGGSRLYRPKVRSIISIFNNISIYGIVAQFGNAARDAHIYEMNVASVCIIGGANTSSLFYIHGATDSSIENSIVDYSVSLTSQSNRAMIYVTGADNFTIANNIFKNRERLIALDVGNVSGDFVRNFNFDSNRIYNFSNPNTAGMIRMDSPAMNGSISSGTIFSNNMVQHFVSVNNPTFVIGEASTLYWPGVLFMNNLINSTNPGTGACFKFDTSSLAATLTGNRCNGTTTFITDSGSRTQYTSLGNFLGSTEQ